MLFRSALGNCSSNGITVASDGNIYVSGRSDSTSVGNGGTGNKSLFLKFNSSLTNQFFKSIDYGTTSGRYNAAYAATQINSTGNIYVTNYQSATSSGGVMSFNTSGVLQWAKSITEGTGGGNFAKITNDGTNYNKIPSQQFANSAFDKANTLVATVAGVTSTSVSNAQLLAGIKDVGGTAIQKMIIIRNYLNTKQFTRVRLFDDSLDNLRMFLSLQNEFKDIKFEAYFAKEDGSVRTVK